MSEDSIGVIRRLANWFAPLVLGTAFLVQPYVADWSDEAEISRKVAAASTRELTANLLGVIYCVVAILAIMAVVGYLRERGESNWSVWSAAALTAGFVLLAAHFALFMGRALVIRNGIDSTAAFGDEAYTDMTGLTGGVLLVLGFFALAAGARKGGLLSRWQARLVVAGTVGAFIGAGLDPGWADWIAWAGTAVIFWTLATALPPPKPAATDVIPASGARGEGDRSRREVGLGV
jgi:hypothetical protein